jgi:hypothetical protein
VLPPLPRVPKRLYQRVMGGHSNITRTAPALPPPPPPPPVQRRPH